MAIRRRWGNPSPIRRAQARAPQPDQFMSRWDRPQARMNPLAQQAVQRGTQAGTAPLQNLSQPTQTAGLRVPAGVPSPTVTPSMTRNPPAYQSISGVYQGRDQENILEQLQAEYEARRDKGWKGDSFLAAHPKFAAALEQYKDPKQSDPQEEADKTLQPGGAAFPNGELAPGLPLSPEFEQGRRMLEDELAAALAQIQVGRDEIPAIVNMIEARLKNDEVDDVRRTNEAANARGLYNSGIRTTDVGRVNQAYGRQRQDVGTEMARTLRDLAGQESTARGGYDRGLLELLLEEGRRTAADPNAPVADIPTPPAETPGETPGGEGRTAGPELPRPPMKGIGKSVARREKRKVKGKTYWWDPKTKKWYGSKNSKVAIKNPKKG